MTYLIEWRTGEKVINESRCLPEDDQSENIHECPDDKEIHSVLDGTQRHYYPGQWVISLVLMLLFMLQSGRSFSENVKHPFI